MLCFTRNSIWQYRSQRMLLLPFIITVDALKPTGLTSPSQSHNSVTLSWTSPPAPGYTNSYVVQYYILGHPPAQSHYMYVNGQDTSTTVPNLSAGTIYNFIIRRTINREGRTQTIPNSDSYPAITSMSNNFTRHNDVFSSKDTINKVCCLT